MLHEKKDRCFALDVVFSIPSFAIRIVLSINLHTTLQYYATSVANLSSKATVSRESYFNVNLRLFYERRKKLEILSLEAM